MDPDRTSPRLWPWLLLAALAGCAAPLPAPPPQASPPAATAPAPAPTEAPPAPPSPVNPAPADAPLLAALSYGDRLRVLSGSELSAELQRLAGLQPTPMTQIQLALALAQTRVPSDSQKANQQLQRLLGQDSPEAVALHPLARLLAAQLAEHRRLEEQSDRQVQQLRDALRRIDQLTDRLDALRAIERERPNRPR